MLRKWILYKNKMWIPIDEYDIKFVNTFNELINLKVSNINAINAIYLYKDLDLKFKIHLSDFYINIIYYDSKIMKSFNSMDYSFKEFEKFLKYFLKTYYIFNFDNKKTSISEIYI